VLKHKCILSKLLLLTNYIQYIFFLNHSLLKKNWISEE